MLSNTFNISGSKKIKLNISEKIKENTFIYLFIEVILLLELGFNVFVERAKKFHLQKYVEW